ncbi:hypothetical protein P170DRAFT_513631 [Aspergillus steynii IBT 23096]|uniref:Uncharacterized protein n=1 Tax=Aspergillus steynii IBT 23096 TaxID=1392250 RepID=A0A2I2FUY3_9EURO|nr:uncharacterized protein P170DRAFT_513631 [Aspergillus steynii IBT 23096]PLB44450.1 hypothetical protein P170DRAFT_513631 [Aspergillus steynii IBT 23096]
MASGCQYSSVNNPPESDEHHEQYELEQAIESWQRARISGVDDSEDPGTTTPAIQPAYGDGPAEIPQHPDASNTSTAESTRLKDGHKPLSVKRKNPFDSGGSWVWEIASETVSIVCLALLIVFLVWVDGSSYTKWQYHISPNSIVSIMATIARAALLVPVSACIGQLKWVHSSTSRELYRLQTLDEASRGPWGSLGLLVTTKPSLASVGSILMVLALAIDPFAQQILSFPLREVPDLSIISYIPRTQEYKMEHASPMYLGDKKQKIAFSLSLSTQLAILKGAFQEGGGVQPSCPTGNCTFPNFFTMGFCSKCEDVSNQANQSCPTYKGSENELGLAPPNPLNNSIQLNLMNEGRENINKTFASIATSLSDNIRFSNKKVDHVNGTTYHVETYIHVRWQWVILPLITTAGSGLLLAITALASRKQDLVLWKSSILPLVMGQLHTNPERDANCFRDVDETRRFAKDVKVVVAQNDESIIFTEQ